MPGCQVDAAARNGSLGGAVWPVCRGSDRWRLLDDSARYSGAWHLLRFLFCYRQIYIDKKTTPEIRGQVQGLLVLLTQGLGFLIGTQLSGIFVNSLGAGGTLTPPDWRLFWGVCAGAALVFALFFYFMFDDKIEDVTTTLQR